MRWNAFNFIEPAISKTSGKLFPFNLKYWTRLGISAVLSHYGSFGGNSGGGNSNVNLPITSNETSRNLTGKVISDAYNKAAVYGIIGVLVFIFLILGLVITYITSVFTFIFIEGMVQDRKDFRIGKSWSSNHKKGVSLFAFRVILALITIGVLLLIALPFIIKVLQIGVTEYFTNITFWGFIGDIMFSLILAIIFYVALAIFNSLAYGFAIPYSYVTSITVWSSIKESFKKIRRQKKESFMYVLSRIVISIISSIILVLALVVVGISLLIIFGLIGVCAYFLLAIISKILAIFIVVLIVILGIFVLLYLMILLALPLVTFRMHHTLLSYEAMFSTKFFKNQKVKKSKRK